MGGFFPPRSDGRAGDGWKTVFGQYLDQKLDVSSSAKAIPLIFTENSGQGHVAVVKRLESKSVEIIDGLGNCQFFLNIRRVAAPFTFKLRLQVSRRQ